MLEKAQEKTVVCTSNYYSGVDKDTTIDFKKTHQCLEIENNPQFYLPIKVQMKKLEPRHLNHAVPATYDGFFKTNVIIDSIKSLFYDYHHTSRLFHPNRHHRADAKLISTYLKTADNLQDVYNYLFDKRHDAIGKSRDEINMSGSFIKRINYALQKLHELNGVSYAPKSTPAKPAIAI